MPLQRIADCSKGFIADVAPVELPDGAWSGVKNMVFRDGFAQRIAGERQVEGTILGAPYWMQSCRDSSNNRWWVYCGLNAAWAAQNSTQYTITRTSGAYNATADTRWTGGVLSGIVIANNPGDAPQFWAPGPANKFADLTNWPANTTCKAMRPVRNHLVALGVTKGGTLYPHMVKWSHPADPGALPVSWDQTDATKDAGEQDLADDPTPVVDLLKLGDDAIVYKEGAYYSMQYIGAPYIWRFQKLSGAAGMLANNCAVSMPAGHIVLTGSDLIVHNGGEPQSILTGVMRRWLFSRFDSTNYRRSVLVHNRRQSEVWVCYPTVGNTTCTEALVWNYKYQSFGVRDLNAVTFGAAGYLDDSGGGAWDSDADLWDSDTTLWDQSDIPANEEWVVLGSTAPALVVADQGLSMNGAPYTSFVERLDMSLGMPERMKYVKGVMPRIDGNGSVSVTLGARDNINATINWAAPQTFAVGADFYCPQSVQGRYISVRIEMTSGIQRFRGVEFDVIPTSYW